MPPNPSADEPADQRAATFACRWRLEGREAASVRVSGDLDLATAAQLDATLREALGFARLVLVDLHEMSYLDSTGLRVILDASIRARTQGAHVVLTGVSAQVETLLEVTRTRAQLDLLDPPHPDRVEQARNGSAICDNPVNARVVPARVMAVSDGQLWMQAADGTLHRPWAPAADGLPVPTGSEVDLYLDATGAVNGWHEPHSGLAINQRGLEPAESPATHADLACAGRCGLVWLAPAAARLAHRRERCLTCAGPLVLR